MLPYGVIVEYGCKHEDKDLGERKSKLTGRMIDSFFGNITIGMSEVYSLQPYLRSLSSMTKQEALELAELSGFKNILSVKVNQDHIIVEVDDGICSSERHVIWFNEIVSSIKILDWLLKNHFDFRGLIELDLALPAPEGMYKLKQ